MIPAKEPDCNVDDDSPARTKKAVVEMSLAEDDTVIIGGVVLDGWVSEPVILAEVEVDAAERLTVDVDD